MTLSCNCDMPLPIYCDWLQDQGWECDELRAEDDAVCTFTWYIAGYGTCYTAGTYVTGTWTAVGSGTGLNIDYATGTGDGYGLGEGMGRVMIRGDAY